VKAPLCADVDGVLSDNSAARHPQTRLRFVGNGVIAIALAAEPQTLHRMAAKKARSPAMTFLFTALKSDAKASYADIKAKADKKKLKLYPVMFGRAQAMLGIVKSAKRGTGKAAKPTVRKTKATVRKTKATVRKTKPTVHKTKPTGKRGRPTNPSSKSGRIRGLLGSGMSVAEIAKKVGATVALVYNVKSKASGSRKAPVAGKKRGPGRPPKAKSSSSTSALGSILAAVQNAEKDRVRMRAALEKMAAVVSDALA
jgi:hypothetical protein